jgi:hypothetical protein
VFSSGCKLCRPFAPLQADKANNPRITKKNNTLNGFLNPDMLTPQKKLCKLFAIRWLLWKFHLIQRIETNK